MWDSKQWRAVATDFFSGCPNQEIGQTFLFEGHKIGTCSYFVAYSANKKTLAVAMPIMVGEEAEMRTAPVASRGGAHVF